MTRYTTTLTFFLFAEGDEDAKKKSKKFAEKIDLEQDNSCNVSELYCTPFASLGSRKVEL